MDQGGSKKFLFFLALCAFLILILILNFSGSNKSPKASASICMWEGQLDQISEEFDALKIRANPTPPEMPIITPSPVTPFNYPAMPVPATQESPTYYPAMPIPLTPTAPTSYPTNLMPITPTVNPSPYYPVGTYPAYPNYNPTNPAQ